MSCPPFGTLGPKVGQSVSRGRIPEGTIHSDSHTSRMDSDGARMAVKLLSRRDVFPRSCSSILNGLSRIHRLDLPAVRSWHSECLSIDVSRRWPPVSDTPGGKVMTLSMKTLRTAVLLTTVAVPLLCLSAFAQQEVDPTYYDPWAAAPAIKVV